MEVKIHVNLCISHAVFNKIILSNFLKRIIHCFTPRRKFSLGSGKNAQYYKCEKGSDIIPISE